MILIICGKKGSGKSTLMLKLLKTVLKGVYHEIIFVSPSFKAQFKSLWCALDPEGITVYEQANNDLIKKFLDHHSDPSRNTLIIFDDNSSDLRKLNPEMFGRLICNSRHYRISMVFLSQSYVQNLPIVRCNTDCYVTFASCSYTERERFYKEVACIERKQFHEYFNRATEKPHSFMVAVIDKGGRMQFYNSDFKTLL